MLSAMRLGMPSVSYYGARNVAYLGETPKAPMMFHFGEQDSSIPAASVQAHRERLPQMDVYSYAGAGHAFNRDVDPAVYDADGARLAWQRTLAFLEQHLDPRA